MNKNILIFGGVALAVAIGLVFAIRSNSTTSTSDVQGTIANRNVQTTEINPFTNVAAIPSTVNAPSIRFEKLRLVDLASKTKTTSDPEACKDRQFRESDPTCQTVSVVERVKAVEAKYSYVGQVLATGEAAPGRDTFSVYFKPEDLAAAGPVEKLNREQAEALFDVTTSRPVMEEKVIDKTNSHYCDGNYVDGNWVRKDPKCQDQVQYKTISVASPNLLVQVDIHNPATAGTK